MRNIIIALLCIIVVAIIINYIIYKYNVMFGDNGISESLGLNFWQTFFLIIVSNIICIIVYSLLKK